MINKIFGWKIWGVVGSILIVVFGFLKYRVESLEDELESSEAKAEASEQIARKEQLEATQELSKQHTEKLIRREDEEPLDDDTLYDIDLDSLRN